MPVETPLEQLYKRKTLVQRLMATPAVFIDGALYVGVAGFAFLQTVFGSDEAAKFIAPIVLFWLKTGVGTASASLLATKLYRSTAFADHQKRQSTGDTGAIVKQ